MGLDKNGDFYHEFTVPAAEALVRFELGFTPTWITVTNKGTLNESRWVKGNTSGTKMTAATGVKAAETSVDSVRPYVGGQVIIFNSDTTPTYKYSKVNGTDRAGGALDAAGDAVAVATYKDLEGNNVLARTMPAVSTSGNGAGMQYVTKPGLQIDTDSLVMVNDAVLIIQAGR